MKLFCISFNITFSPCNCAEFIVHGPRPSPSNFCPYKQQSLPFAHATKPGSHTVLLSEGEACWGAWGRALHTVSSHLPFPFGAEAPHFSKPNWYSFERSIWLFGSSTEVILVVWEFLLPLSHGLGYWKGFWHFNVPVSGHEECEKAEVCLYLQSLFEICEAENNFFPT